MKRLKLFLVLLICTIVVFPICIDDFFSHDKNEELRIEKKINMLPFHQSAACYGDYLFLVSDKLSKVYVYNMREYRKEFEFLLKKSDEKDYMGKVLFHCNQSSFAKEKFLDSDFFPLLYISHRARFDKKCFTEVYRILSQFEDNQKLLSIDFELVQTIYFPVMSESNSMGNVNTVLDLDLGYLYTYSRNNNCQDTNYGQCKISKFLVPSVAIDTISFSNSDVVESYFIDCKAFNMQGAAIKDNRLYICQGLSNSGRLRVVDLEKKKLMYQFDLCKQGYTQEPEGCFFYNDELYLSSRKGIDKIIIY